MSNDENEAYLRVIRSEFDRYESAIGELKGLGTEDEHWLHAEPRSDKWFHYIVCALRYNTITPTMFRIMDEKPGRWGSKYSTWHWKLRSCRNHSKWSQELFEALEENANKVAKGQ